MALSSGSLGGFFDNYIFTGNTTTASSFSEMPLPNQEKSGNLSKVKMWLINAYNGISWCKKVYISGIKTCFTSS